MIDPLLSTVPLSVQVLVLLQFVPDILQEVVDLGDTVSVSLHLPLRDPSVIILLGVSYPSYNLILLMANNVSIFILEI